MTHTSNRPLAVVTGASSGIGFELAREFARRGFDLIVASAGDRLHNAAQQLESGGAQVQLVQADLASYEGVENLVNQIRETGRPVDALAINAGVGVGGDFARETDLRAELNLINLNVTSAVHLAKRLIPGMVLRRQGRVLITSSIAATMPAPLEAVYGASKAFLLSFAEGIRNELKDTGVTVTALLPGPTETDFFHRAGLDNSKVGQSEKDDPAQVAREGIDALMEGKDKVVAGSFKNQAMVTGGRILPDQTKAEMHRKQAEPVHP